MTARERLVRVVAEALSVRWDNLLEAEAVVAAIEAKMGLRVESEPVSSITISGPGGSLTVPGPLQYRLVTDWISDEGGGE